MNLLTPALLVLITATSSGPAQQASSQPTPATPAAVRRAPTSAAKLLLEAQSKAKAENKNVMVIFHASWCKWCKRLDSFMAEPRFKPVFQESFVDVHLTVMERDERRMDENPGGADVMAALGGKDAGLPFFAILAPDGKMIVNSLMPVEGKPGQNTGFPTAPEEIAHFISMMKKAAPKATSEQLAEMQDFLSKR